MRYFLISFLVLFGFATSVTAQQNNDRKPVFAKNWILAQLGTFARLRAGSSLEKIQSQISAGFQRMDLNGGGISQEDYDIGEQIKRARMRAITISSWAKNDLDGNGLVSRKEYSVMLFKRVPQTLRFGGEKVATTAEQRANLTQKSVDRKMKADIDADGSVSMQEAIAASGEKNQNMRRYRSRSARQRRIPVGLDLNQDDTVTLDEFTAATDKVLKRLDADGNGVLSYEEVEYYQQLRKRAKRALPL